MERLAVGFGSIVLTVVLLVACGAPSPNPSNPENPSPNPPTGSNSLRYSGRSYPLERGLLERIGQDGYHYQADLTLTDGAIVPIVVYIEVGGIPIPFTYWVATDATVELFTELFAAGSTLMAGSYTFFESGSGDPGRPSLEGQNFFTNAYVGIDKNSDNQVSDDEKLRVTGGTLTLTETGGALVVQFDLQLANGQQVTGRYQGDVMVVD